MCLSACSLQPGKGRQCFDTRVPVCHWPRPVVLKETKALASLAESRSAQEKGPGVFPVHGQTQLTVFTKAQQKQSAESQPCFNYHI